MTGSTIFGGLPMTPGAVGGPQSYPLSAKQAYLLKLDSTGSTLAYGTYIGGSGDDTRAIDNFMVRLRRYIEDDPTEPRHLLTVRGVGYRFVATPRQS